MIVYDKEQKEIVIPNGIGNINLFNNGVEAGYNQGKIDGIDEQKSKLESIIIVNNGTYRKEDGYNKVVVYVPDFNGSYEEGYKQGQIDMESNARVLNVTENGVYRSKFSDDMPPIAYTVTGVYADGTKFYNCAELNGKIFNTKIAATIDSRLEFWYKGDYTLSGDAYNVIIGAGNNDDNHCFQVRYYNQTNNTLHINIGNDDRVLREWDETVWHHLIVSKAEGIWIDGKKEGDLSPTNTVNGEFFINGINYDVKLYNGGKRNANGCFGMIKIDDTIIIPTADGFLNTNTGELLEVVKDGGYTFRENDPIYGEGELYKTINVNVPDLNGSYEEGYAQGKTDGINEQKGKLESISITENGTYRKEDGYNEVVVNVADLNGSYEEGYEQGQADVAANARVLNVTENGVYQSKFSDPIPIGTITGVYADGTEFNNYAELNGKIFNTKIAATVDSRLELWYKGDNTVNDSSGEAIIIGSGNNDNDDCFRVRYTTYYNDRLRIEIGNSTVYIYDWDDTVWHHLIVSKTEGFWIDGDKKGDFSPTNTVNGEFFINGISYAKYANANGCYGMIKIDDVVIIPTADGFLNTNTGELLEVVQDGGYTFTEGQVKYGEGELYKTINVNVIPKINLQEAGLKFGYSKFTEVPEWVDFEGITDMSNMFYECNNLQTIPSIDTSIVTNMGNLFNNCANLQAIPLIDTSKVTNMGSMFYNCTNLQTIPSIDTSIVTNMGSMFYNCNKLQTIPQLNTSNVTDMSNTFAECYSLTSLPALNAQSLNMWSFLGVFGYNELSKLTDFGGFINLKHSLTSDDNLKRLPNLTKESCINVLNGLYDFTGNGETPNSDQGQLKVAQSFIDKVGDEISIATNKGWVVSA